jgi:threonine dehydratase
MTSSIKFEDIQAARQRIAAQIILEGGGAVGIAALVAAKVSPGKKTIVLLSGKNINMQRHRKIINREEY